MRRITAFVLAFTAVCLLCSCASVEAVSCGDAIAAGLSVIGGEACGQIYLANAEEGSLEYFSEELKLLIYGEHGAERILSRLEDHALYVSSREPSEISVMLCRTRGDTVETAALCLERADTVKVALRGTEWSEQSENIIVSVKGRYVITVFCENARAVERKICGML